MSEDLTDEELSERIDWNKKEVERLARELDTSPEQMRRSLIDLERRGLIETIPGLSELPAM